MSSTRRCKKSGVKKARLECVRSSKRRIKSVKRKGVALNVSENFWDETVVPNSQGHDPRYPHLAFILPRETPIENVPLFERKKRDKIDDKTKNADKNENVNNNDDDAIDMPPEIP
ncbi:hypothetical protein TNCT_296861 [Trichonephila clavata]|uniref:Uncharacterized protein n=1 Tax=Trichonephila clavata TaxID=2740835 RepID=A0A8X6KRF5_TRICU|nr:hypothetical protein TNCT_296861 [Trichonephila clavata]